MCVWILPKLISSIRILYKNLFWTLPNAISPHLDSIHCQSNGFRNLQSLSAPFGFLYAINKMGFRTVPNLISPIWIWRNFKKMGFWNLPKSYQPHFDLIHSKNNKSLDDPSLIPPHLDLIHFEKKRFLDSSKTDQSNLDCIVFKKRGGFRPMQSLSSPCRISGFSRSIRVPGLR